MESVIPPSPARDVRRAHAKWIYEHFKPSNGSNKPNPSLGEPEVQLPQTLQKGETSDQEETPSHQEILKTPRSIVLEKVNASIPIGNEDDLRREIKKAGSEIPEETLVALIKQLAVEDSHEISKQYKTEMVTGNNSPFKRFRVIKKGARGTLLYFIDEAENLLRVRIGPHDEIYAGINKGKPTRKGK